MASDDVKALVDALKACVEQMLGWNHTGRPEFQAALKAAQDLLKLHGKG
jgi:hypothetical protein